jgi:hypothetical protein
MKYLDDGDWVAAAFDVERLNVLCSIVGLL